MESVSTSGRPAAREELLSAVIRATSLLLSDTDHENNMAQALGWLGQAAGSDYACVLQNHAHPQTGARLMTKRFEWCAPGVPPLLDHPSLHDLPYDPALTRLYQKLARNEIIFEHVGAMPETERPVFQTFNIRTVLMLPLHVRRAFWGHFTLTTIHTERAWTPDEISILRNAAASISGALDRRAQEQELQARDRLLQGVSQATNSLLAAPTIEEGIRHALQGLGEAAQVERAYIFENEQTEADEPARLRARYLWMRPDAGDPIPPERIPTRPYEELFPRWHHILKSGRTISGRVTDFIRPAGTAGAISLRSILLVPITIEDSFWGFLGFDDPNVERVWLSADESILHAVADSFGAALARHRAQEALRQSEERFRQAQKMEAIGRLAGGVAHDFNNLLTAIMGYGEMMLGQLRSGDPLHREVQEICKAADRAHALTRQLLAFSRKQVLEPKILNLNAAIGEIEKLLRRLIGEDVQLETDLAHDISMVRVDQGQIEQAIINLAVNARDAMPNGGRLTIRTYNTEIVKRVTRGHAFVEPGRYVALSITDTGEGMDEFVQARIFEPFFTTKEVGRGTGLGLSMVYGIVQQSNGYVMFESERSTGTRFTLYFPRIDEPPAPAPAGEPKAAAAGSETILLVEDEDVVRDLAVRILSDRGYRVIPARNGQEAYDLLVAARSPIDLVLTDIVMPHMSGRALAQRIRTSHPDLRIVFMSGYAAEETFAGFTDIKHFIQKPFTPSALATVVREVLDAPR